MFYFHIYKKNLPDHVQYINYEEYRNKWAVRHWKDKNTLILFRNYSGAHITNNGDDIRNKEPLKIIKK